MLVPRKPMDPMVLGITCCKEGEESCETTTLSHDAHVQSWLGLRGTHTVVIREADIQRPCITNIGWYAHRTSPDSMAEFPCIHGERLAQLHARYQSKGLSWSKFPFDVYTTDICTLTYGIVVFVY